MPGHRPAPGVFDMSGCASHNPGMTKPRPRPTPEVIEQALDRISPFRLAEDWDNVGVLLATSRTHLKKVMLTIDLTEPVLEEALAGGAEGVIAYHPPIFSPIKRLADRDRTERVLRRAAAADLWIASPHTALDAAAGGLNDWLVRGLGEGVIKPLVHATDARPDQAYKILTYIPVASVDVVRIAMAEAGAGRIGEYTHCSCTVSAVGTFLGGDASNPVVGRRGRLESVEEGRLEMVCGESALPAAIAALRESHPYEEPPIKIHRLEAEPLAGVGQGRVIELDRPIPIAELASRCRSRLQVDSLELADAGRRRVKRIGVCAGSGGSLVESAAAAGCDAFLTGEMSHHQVLDANERGVAILLAGHTNTERPYLPVLARRLRKAVPALTVAISRRDRHPLRRI